MRDVIDKVFAHLFQIMHPGHIISDQETAFTPKAGHLDLYIMVFKDRRLHLETVRRIINMMIIINEIWLRE